MKKSLLLFLMMVLSIIVLSGCNGLVPSEGEIEGESEVIPNPCPTVSITSEQIVEGKPYIKGGSPQTITITFNEPTEPVSAFIGDAIDKNPTGVPDDATEVVLYTEDNLTYTGTYTFTGDCAEDYIYVLTCATCLPCKYPYKVDATPPYATVEICIDDCACEGCTLNFTSTVTDGGCAADVVNCGDDCSGLDSWAIDIYDKYPFNSCCDASCEEPIDSYSGSSCSIEFTTSCLTEKNTYYVVVNLTDKVGNNTKWGTQINYDADLCEAISISYLDSNECLDDPSQNKSGFVICEKLAARALTMVVDPAGGGTATDQTGTAPYVMGESVNILAVSATGYEFVNWTAPAGSFADANDPSTTFTMPAADVTVTANFEVSGYTLTMAVDPIGGGTATDQTGSSPYAENTLINILADPASEYKFLYWTTPGGVYDANFGDANGPSTTFTMPGVNTTVTARFLEFVQNNKTFSEDCNEWTGNQSASGVGITIDIWDITSIANGNTIDFQFNAYSVPDRWFIYYNGVLAHATGWRGDSSYDGNPLYPGGVISPGSGAVTAVVTKLNGVNTLEIRTEGAQAGTASYYNLRENCPQ